MDCDELFSRELTANLPEIVAMSEAFVCLPRRTFSSLDGAMRFVASGDTGAQIHNYPDYQPRVNTISRFMKYFRSPHHLTLNCGEQRNVNLGDIVHYERVNKNRMPSTNGQWEGMVEKGKLLGLNTWYSDHTGNQKPGFLVTVPRHKVNKIKDVGAPPFMRWENEFSVFVPYLTGLGIDIGCGTDRLSDTVLSLDSQPNAKYAYADVICDARKIPMFKDGTFDFVFSSHCLEDFETAEIPVVLREWLRILKSGGNLCLLLPDMEGGRYPKAGDKAGNPSHKTDIGIKYFKELTRSLPLQLVQSDTIPHEWCSFDLVYKKL
jgi:SAM-dependent methyltransferase